MAVTGLILLLLLLISIASGVQECGLQKAYTVQTVINGNTAASGQFPWTVSLFRESDYKCGGTILDNMHVLTAAHCVKPFRTENIRIFFGRHNLANKGENTWIVRNVSEAFMHKDFNKTSGNHDADIAVLRFSQPISFTDKIQPICLPESDENLNDVVGTVVGYGQNEIPDQHEDIPRYIEGIETVDLVKCYGSDSRYFFLISERTFCAGGMGKGPCSGDSGGGFLMKSKRTNRWTLYGIVGASLYDPLFDTCDVNKYAVYTNIFNFLDWIKAITGIESIRDPIPKRCTEALAIGTCNGEELKYFFDIKTSKCRRFFYSGCNGNGNRFDSMQDCQNYCQSLQTYRRCEELASECRIITCAYGITRSSDEDTECEKCECYDPCHGHSCLEGQRCVVLRKFEGYAPKFVPECHQVSKPGSCPIIFAQNYPDNLIVCNDDADCSGDYKCCQYVTFRVCLLPIVPPKIGELSFEELSGEVGGSVTLECRTNGDSKPTTITWTHNGAKVEPGYRRYVLPVGDLKIVYLKMTDAGKYVCIANDIFGGRESKEYLLTVRQFVRGEKENEELDFMRELRTFYTFVPFESTTINTKNFEIASDRDDRVTAIEALDIRTIFYLPINVAEVFPKLINYQVLECSVTEVSKQNFRNMKNLEQLTLLSNKISSIDKDSFEDLHALRRLDVRENRLTSLHEDTFRNNRGLEELHLRDNQIKSLPPRLLHNLHELKGIGFGKNKLRTLHTRFFENNLKLENIYLQQNQIECLSASTFAGLVRLQYVSLGENKCISRRYGNYLGKIHKDLSRLSPDLVRQCSQTFACYSRSQAAQ